MEKRGGTAVIFQKFPFRFLPWLADKAGKGSSYIPRASHQHQASGDESFSTAKKKRSHDGNYEYETTKEGVGYRGKFLHPGNSFCYQRDTTPVGRGKSEKSAPLFIILLAILRVMWFGRGGKGEENVWKKKGGGNEDEGKEGGGRREIVELARKIRPRISAKRIRSDRYRAKQSSLLTLAKYWMATANIRLNYTLPLA